MPASHEPSPFQLAAYALPALPLAVLTLPLYVLVPNFYATSLGIPLAAVGLTLLAVRLIDAASDLVVGVLADRTLRRFGRRRTWFAVGIPATALAAFMIFVPRAGADASYLFLWGTLLSIGWTATLVPYAAWGAELSTTYQGRNRVAAAREGVVFLGTLLALTLQAAFNDTSRTLGAFAVIVGIGLPLAAVVTLASVGEPQDRSVTRLTLADGFRLMRRNAPFVRLVAAFVINGLANGLPATLFLFFVARKLGAEQHAGALLVVYFLAGIVAIPGWIALARRVGKPRAWCLALILACVAFAFAPMLGTGDVAAFVAICMVTGLAVGADLVLPASLQADVIDVDTAASGEQRSGLYLAIWALATKLALAAAVGIAFPLLALAGFDPESGADTTAGLLALGLLYAGLPVAFKAVAIALMWRFPLSEADQSALRARIEARMAN